MLKSSYTIVYKDCPDRGTTFGASLGYANLFELAVTIVVLPLLMLSGVLNRDGEFYVGEGTPTARGERAVKSGGGLVCSHTLHRFSDRTAARFASSSPVPPPCVLAPAAPRVSPSLLSGEFFRQLLTEAATKDSREQAKSVASDVGLRSEEEEGEGE